MHGNQPNRGFSLIELAVVVAIMGILSAIAIPTFLGQREGAQDRSAQSSLRNAVVQSRASSAANNAVVPGANDADLVALLQADEPALGFGVGASTGPSVISVSRVGSNEVILAAMSDSGSCWYVYDNLDSGTKYGLETEATNNGGAAGDDPVVCNANDTEVTIGPIATNDFEAGGVGGDDFANAWVVDTYLP